MECGERMRTVKGVRRDGGKEGGSEGGKKKNRLID
jgi:hypothetical protein